MIDTKDSRLPALRRFATAITVLNILGHTVLGFEQSIAYPIVGVLAAYATEILFELIESWRLERRPRFLGGGAGRLIDFLLSAHISGLAVSMLLYSNQRVLPIAFGAAMAIASKYLFRVTVGQGSRHFFNPSNLGITATLLCFHWVSIAQPYMFTENLNSTWDWVLPAVIVCTGSFLNARFTHKVPLILAWLGGFVLQATIRHFVFDHVWQAALNPMTGVAFLLFTFYMVTDPATTPTSRRGQIAFGLSVAATYSVLVLSHVVFDLFFALTLVCIGRGAQLWVQSWLAHRSPAAQPVGVGAAVGQPGL
jgi:hypothetical protein